MFTYLRRPLVDAMAAALGRCLIVYLFTGAAIWHLRSAGWQPTIEDMQTHGVPFPQWMLMVAMTVSSLASLALLVDFKSRYAAYVLAGYTLVVSSVMHNPLHTTPAEFFLFVKDLGVAGALMALAASYRCLAPVSEGKK